MKKIYIIYLLSMFINSDDENSTQCNLYTDNVMGGKSTLNIYTDDVMGGKSTLEENSASREYIHLMGEVTTENNGGFVRMGCQSKNKLSKSAKGLKFMAKGNNEAYEIHITLSGMKMPPWSFFRKEFKVNEEWQEFFIEFNDFEKYGYSLKSFKPQNFREIAFAGYGRDFKVDLFLKDIELITE